MALAKGMGSESIEFIESRLEGKFQLEINREKTRVVDLREAGASLNFLGYTFRYDRDLKGRGRKYLNVFPSQQAVQREREKLHDMTNSHQCFKPIPVLIGADGAEDYARRSVAAAKRAGDRDAPGTGWIRPDPDFSPDKGGRHSSEVRQSARLFRLQRSRERRDGRVDRELTLRQAAMGTFVRRKRKYRRHCLAGDSRNDRSLLQENKTRAVQEPSPDRSRRPEVWYLSAPTSDDRFRAFDSKTGQELGAAKLDYNATAVPVSFQGKSGKQYIAVVAAGGNQGNGKALVAFALHWRLLLLSDYLSEH